MEAVQKELCEVKELYLAVCEEKNRIEDEITEKLTKEHEHLLAQVWGHFMATFNIYT